MKHLRTSLWTLVLAAACSPARPSELHAAEPGEPALTVEGRRSFREMGVRKTAVQGGVSGGAVQLSSVSVSPGIRPPALPLPFEVSDRWVIEIEWLADAREGTVTIEWGEPRQQTAVHVAYP